MNPYANKSIDFSRLLEKDDRLQTVVGRNINGEYRHIDFKNPSVLRAVTEATFLHEFGITITLKEDRLCPPIPNRLDYLAWIEEIWENTYLNEIEEFSEKSNDELSRSASAKRIKVERDKFLRISDIGTGSSCVYPLLGSAMHSNWQFIGTDIDNESIRNARDTIANSRNERNCVIQYGSHPLNLARRIRLLLREMDQPILPDLQDIRAAGLDLLPSTFPPFKDGFLYHITMCNPPFYANYAEMIESLNAKATTPNSTCHGSSNEMIYEGGEEAFIRRMIGESIRMKDKVIWFTTLIGKLSDVKPVVEELQKQKANHFQVTDFLQGKTKRWAVIWTFSVFRLPILASPHKASQSNNGQHLFEIKEKVEDLLSLADQLQVHLQRSGFFVKKRQDRTKPFVHLIVLAKENTWSRKARRSESRRGSTEQRQEYPKTPIVGVRISLKKDGRCVTQILTAWILGRERQLYDSFCMSVVNRWVKNQHG